MKLFLSYSSSDRDWAHWIGVTLRDAGHEVFVHEWEVAAGENIPAWMERKLEAADKMVGVFSPAYVEAVHSNAERWAAYWQDPDGRDGFLVPIEVEKLAKWPAFAANKKRLSLIGLDEAEAARRLIAFLEPPRAPTTRPRFPGGAGGGAPQPSTAVVDVQLADATLSAEAKTPPFDAGSAVLPPNAPRFPSERVEAAGRSGKPPISKIRGRMFANYSVARANPSPVIRSRDELERWLEGKPREYGRILAVRAALRVAPLLAGLEVARNSKVKDPLIALAPLLRGLAVPWAEARYPAHATAIKRTAFAAAAAAASAAEGASYTIALTSNTTAAYAAATATAIAAAANVDAAIAVTTAVNAASTATAAAAPANATSSFAFFAREAIMWEAVSIDIAALVSEVDVAALAEAKLWPNGAPDEIANSHVELSNKLRARHDEGWQHWLAWLDDRFSDDPVRLTGDEEKDIARLTLPEEMWAEGAKTIAGVKAVNAEIARRFAEIDARRARSEVPPQPEEVEGTSFEFGANSGLRIAAPSSPDDVDDAEVSGTLHDQLRSLLPRLREATHKVSNRHPDLAHVVALYADLIDVDAPALHVSKLWGAGAELFGLAEAFAGQNQDRTLTDPLEPAHLGMLTAAARLHGAFILGFPLGRKLTANADQFRLASETLATIGRPMAAILEAFGGEDDWVEDETRRFLSAIGATYHTTGWKLATSSHAAYVAVRNALLVVTRHVVKANSALATVAGGLVLSRIDPGLEMTQMAISFIGEHVETITAFAAPFPELRAWFAWVIDHLDGQNAEK